MKLRLLVADDEELARAAIRKMVDSFFDDFGEIVEAARGDEVVATARRFRPHLVLLDVRMPGLNGLDAAAQMLATNPDTRIVVVTAYDRFSLAQRAVNLGLDGYLLKPVIEEEFRRIVAEVIRRIERDASRGRPSSAAAADQGPLAGSDLTAFEDRIIRSLLRGRLPSPAEAADELVSAWEAAGLTAAIRLRAFAFAIAREAERFAHADPTRGVPRSGGRVDAATNGLPPGALVADGSPREALAEILLAWACPSDPGSNGSRNRILDWLSETPVAELSLDALAARLRSSPASASRTFREEIGKSFAAYVAALRMERAVAIAAAEELTMEELGRRVGYSDPAYFGRLFKEHTGMSPRDFARARREEARDTGQGADPS
jgi:two-component system response regulator YesN